MQDHNPKISVIIPLYNHEKYIKEAICSVLEQTFSDLELIIINDGSTDKSEEVVKSINDDRIQYLYQENQGAHNSINRGIQLAHGEYVSILNSDDVYYKNRFEEALKILESDSSICAVFSHLEFIDENGEFIKFYRGAEDYWKDLYPETPYKGTNDIVLDLLGGNFLITTSNLFCRINVFKDIGYFTNLRYAHDYDLFLRLCSHYKTYIINAPLLKYRKHGANTIKENEAITTFEIGLVLSKFFLNYDFNDVFEDEKQRYEAMERLFYSINPNHSENMIIIILLYMMRNKDNKDQIFKELAENAENPFRKACIDGFKNYIDLWQSSQKAWKTSQEAWQSSQEAWQRLEKVREELRSSFSYRLGRALTWPVRKLLGKTNGNS